MDYLPFSASKPKLENESPYWIEQSNPIMQRLVDSPEIRDTFSVKLGLFSVDRIESLPCSSVNRLIPLSFCSNVSMLI